VNLVERDWQLVLDSVSLCLFLVAGWLDVGDGWGIRYCMYVYLYLL